MDERLEKKTERYFELISKGEFSTPRNNETLIKFYNNCKARNLSPARFVIYFDKLKMACRIIGDKDFQAWEKEDVEILFSAMAQKGYSAWTMETEKAVLKAFFKWLQDSEEVPKFLKWLKGETPPSKLTKEKLLTPEEVEKMLQATRNTLWQALIAVYTSGARPNEIHNIRIRDVVDMGDMVKIYVGEKGGKMAKLSPPRPVYIQRFADYIRPWIRHHPQRKNPEAWLFVNGSGERIAYDDMRKISYRLGKKAGIQKHVFPYLFRHSIATWLYGKHDSVYARRMLGHCSGSKMEAVYCHLNEDDIENELRGNKGPQSNSLNFSNIEGIDDSEEFLQFISATKMKMLEMWKEWKAQKP